MKNEINLNKVLYRIKKKLKYINYQSITIYYKKHWHSKPVKLIYSKTLDKNICNEEITKDSYFKSLNNIFNHKKVKKIRFKKGLIIIIKLPNQSNKKIGLNILEALNKININNSKKVLTIFKFKQQHYCLNKNYKSIQKYKQIKEYLEFLKKYKATTMINFKEIK